MTQEELRVGNWVQRPKDIRIDILDGERIYYLVDDIMIRDCGYYKDNWAFEPIPLTPEILQKCGFKKNNVRNGYYHSKLELSVYFDDKKLSILSFERYEKLYLHELQNLVFALTGEELIF